VDWLGHSGILIKDSKVIYIDPYMIRDNLEKADFILSLITTMTIAA